MVTGEQRRSAMATRDLVPWNSRGREVGGRRHEEPHPILSLHREMNRLFVDVFRGFDLCPFNNSLAAHPAFHAIETGTGLIEPRTGTARLLSCAVLPG